MFTIYIMSYRSLDMSAKQVAKIRKCHKTADTDEVV